MDETITKRLHISGLTPALTPDDLSKRFSTFGTVKSLDGFGLLDGLGQPRKFGYITLETTVGNLTRCLTLLSGSTWKGTKLRIGEARPDFAERLAAERQASLDEPPKKKRRQCGGVYAEDMSLVTPENVTGRKGWKITPLGRILRPVRMRPDRPLPPVIEDKKQRERIGTSKVYVDGKNEEKRKKKRLKDPDTRARRRTVDMTRWGSVHLKGMFLGSDVVGAKLDVDKEAVRDITVESDEGDESEVDQDGNDRGKGTNMDLDEVLHDLPLPITPSTESPTVTPTHAATFTPAPTISEPKIDDIGDITAEKNKSLNLLASLFGGKNDADWIGRESIGSDIDEAELTKERRVLLGDEDDEAFEIIPMDADDIDEDAEHAETTLTDARDNDGLGLEPKVIASAIPESSQKQQATKLKDLFAPREDDAEFSLLGHLDLDLELDDAMTFATVEPLPAQESTPAISHLPPFTASQSASYPIPQLNSKQALFFPLFPSSGPSNKARPKDIFEVAKENGWDWRDPNVGFFRTETEEEIRKRWEEEKVGLTRDWKRRCREAGKISRRKRGKDREDGDIGIGE